MKSALVGGVAAALMMGGAALPADAAPGKGRVGGTIEGTGLQPAKLTVWLLGKDVHETSVAADGSFNFRGIPAGRYEVALSYRHDGRTVEDYEVATVRVEAGERTEVDLGYAVVTGTVTRGGEVFGRAPAGVSLTGTGVMYDVDADGSYLLFDAMDGATTQTKLRIDSWNAAWASEWYEDAVTAREATPITLTAGQNQTIDVDLERATVIKGRIDFPAGHHGRAGNYVTLHHEDGRVSQGAGVGPRGSFRFQGLTPGTYLLGFARIRGSSTIAAGFHEGADVAADATRIVVRAGETARLGTLTPERGSTASGRVVNGAGKARDDLRVWAVPQDAGDYRRQALTDERGRFRVTGLSAGTYRLKVWNGDFPMPGRKACQGKVIATITVDGDGNARVGTRVFKRPTVDRC